MLEIGTMADAQFAQAVLSLENENLREFALVSSLLGIHVLSIEVATSFYRVFNGIYNTEEDSLSLHKWFPFLPRKPSKSAKNLSSIENSLDRFKVAQKSAISSFGLFVGLGVLVLLLDIENGPYLFHLFAISQLVQTIALLVLKSPIVRVFAYSFQVYIAMYMFITIGIRTIYAS